MGSIQFLRVDNAPGCPGEIVERHHYPSGKLRPISNDPESPNYSQSILVQLDYDFPGVASVFGWNIREVQCDLVCLSDEDGNPSKLAIAPCEHSSTDGTIDCSCGVKAMEFISAAYDYLVNEADGKIVEDPGYFGG